jgi:hemerythrin
MNYPPLKRHPALQPLSRDHYVGLVQAQRLLKAADADVAARREAARQFMSAWEAEIAEHFADEERLLPALIHQAGDRDRLLDEHTRLRALAAEAERSIAGEPGSDLLRALGTLLHDHIRWEERQLFPVIEAAANPDQLTRLEEETHTIETSRPRSACRPVEGVRE